MRREESSDQPRHWGGSLAGRQRMTASLMRPLRLGHIEEFHGVASLIHGPKLADGECCAPISAGVSIQHITKKSRENERDFGRCDRER